MHRLIRRIGDASARRPWATIAAWAVAAAIVMGLAGTAGGGFVDDLVAPGSQSEEAMRLLEERFPEAAAGSAMAVFAAPDGGRLEHHRPAIEAAVARIGAVEHVATVADPFTAGTVSPDGRIGSAAIAFDRPSMELGPEPLAHCGELASRDLRCQRRTRRAEHGDQGFWGQKEFQRHEIQASIGAAGESIDRAEVVVGVEAHLRHRRPLVALLDIARPDINQLTEQLHAVLIGVVEVQPQRAVVPS